jgi:N-acetylmuramoyl-L-alanine amidase
MNKKNFYSVVISILAACVFCGAHSASAQGITRSALHKIIVDPGHGGADPGAHGQFSTEAAVSLSIALKLGDALAKELPDVKVVFTRTTDLLPGGGTNINEALRYRANLANQSKGDLFVSIHCNAAGARPGGWYAKRVVGHKNKTVYVGKGSKRRKKTVRQPIYETYWVKNQQHGTETLFGQPTGTLTRPRPSTKARKKVLKAKAVKR